MILKDISDYHKHHLLIPKSETSIQLDAAIKKYQNIIRRRKKITSSNEHEIDSAYKHVSFLMEELKQELINCGLWG